MGAVTFSVSAKGEKTSESCRGCFYRLVEKSAHESGTECSGQIGMKKTFVIIEHTQNTDKEIEQMAQRLIDTEDVSINETSGPAGALWLPESKEWLFFGWAAD